jgi:transaldolase
MNKLEKLREMTTIVCDTGDIQSIKQYKPQDATTNPSLILAAAKEPQYTPLIEEAIAYGKSKAHSEEERRVLTMERLFINFGKAILDIVPGRVSTEVDAHLSFDTAASIQKAKTFIRLYEEAGISRERILIKLASTWEGILAARELEKDQIHCNMTLMFSLPQAIGSAEAHATLVSPFVGRILDWHKKNEGRDFAPHEDPGVLSVTQIYNYFKKFDYNTQVMGASFRNMGEILELAGCDLLTISPQFLQELTSAQGPVERKLSVEKAKQSDLQKIILDEKTFRWEFNKYPMAIDKLAEGIRKFAEDAETLENMVMQQV